MLSRSQIVHFDIIIVSFLLYQIVLLIFYNGPWSLNGIKLRSIFERILRLLYNLFSHPVIIVSVIRANFFNLQSVFMFLFHIVDLFLCFKYLRFELFRLNFKELVAFYNNFVVRIIVHIRILLFLVLLPHMRLDVFKDTLKSL